MKSWIEEGEKEECSGRESGRVTFKEKFVVERVCWREEKTLTNGMMNQ